MWVFGVMIPLLNRPNGKRLPVWQISRGWDSLLQRLNVVGGKPLPDHVLLDIQNGLCHLVCGLNGFGVSLEVSLSDNQTYQLFREIHVRIF